MAALSLSMLFSNDAVLQRDAPLPIWGKAKPDASVTVELAGKTQTAKADSDGRWRAILPPLPAGGPYKLTIKSENESLERTRLMMGDVWLCAGQSNMQWTVAQCINADEEIAAAAIFPRLRLFLVPKNGTNTTQSEFTGPSFWRSCTPDNVRDFSSLAYLYGRELHDSPALKDVAIGIIDCSFGGTKVEAWMSQAWLEEKFPGEPLRDSIFGFKPTAMFNAMIAPLAPYPVRGVLWYQGESNAAHPVQYGRLLPGMITEWRNRWNQPEMPFFLVQLPNWVERIDTLHFTWVREQQARVADADPHVHMAVAIDAGDDYDLHPRDKRPIAHRLALLARARVYDEPIASESPAYQSHEITGDKILVKFSNADGGLINKNADGSLRGFAIAGDDGIFRYAEATINGSTVTLRHSDVPAPRHARYAMEGAPRADLFSAAGLPAAPFRTDDFPPDTVDILRLPQPYMFRSPRFEANIDGGACMTSLMIRGQQFIYGSNPAIPGTFFKSAFGAIRLYHFREDGPRLLFAEMDNSSIQFEFREYGMTWILQNRTAQPMPYCMILSPQIESVLIDGKEISKAMPAESNFKSVAFKRGEATLEIRGDGGKFLKTFSEHDPQSALEWNLGPNESRRIEFIIK